VAGIEQALNSCVERSNSLREPCLKNDWPFLATVLLTFGLVVGSAMAVELAEAVRTLPLNDG